MKTDAEFYFRNIARRWKQACGNTDERVLIFSPYLTSSTADTVLEEVEPEDCDLHTLFAAEHFANSRSSLKTLKTLSTKGVQLYAIDRLHAKIVLIPSSFASIGSQNLTHYGTRSREASVVFTEEKAVRRIEKQVAPWVAVRTPITPDMIADMEELLGPVTLEMKEVEKKAIRVDDEISQRAKARKDKHKEEVARQRIKKLQAVISSAQKAPKIVYATVRKVPTGEYFNDGTFSSHTISLLADAGTNMTAWPIGGAQLKLGRTSRYLCILNESGKFGWARVVKTRITFVGQSVIRQETVTLGGEVCQITLTAKWNGLAKSHHNVTIKVTPLYGTSNLEYKAWFGLGSLDVLPDDRFLRSSNDTVRDIAQWITTNPAQFKSELLQLLLSPFVYESNLEGVEADSFFGSIGTTYELRLARVKNYQVLVATHF